jgi:hypothetical protein
MMLRLAIGIMLLTSSAHAAAVTSVAVADPLDVSEAQDARAASPAASAIGARPAAPDQVQAVTAQAAPAPARALSANPLWAVPLTALSGTRDRPIFSSSRRPPPAADAMAAPIQAVAPPKPREPDRPKLSLVGTIASGDEGFGIFLDQSTSEALRLKIGEDYQGWRLRSVQGREATLEKDQQVVTLALPQPGAGQMVSEVGNEEAAPDPATSGMLSPASSRRRRDREGR